MFQCEVSQLWGIFSGCFVREGGEGGFNGGGGVVRRKRDEKGRGRERIGEGSVGGCARVRVGGGWMGG